MICARLNIVVSVSHPTNYDGVNGPVIVETKREKIMLTDQYSISNDC
jgi:hypothetical protein